MKLNWEIIWEGVKEPLREIALAVIPSLLAVLGTIDAKWAAALYLLLRLADSLLHEFGKEGENKNLITGLTRF